MPRLVRRIRRVATDERGYSLVELVAVMAILATVVTTLTSLFVSGARAEIDMNRRFEAQQRLRTAVDRMRREIHCSSGITITNAASITVTLPAACPTSGGAQVNIVYDTQLVSTGRYRLRRAGSSIANYLTDGNIFSYVAPSTSTLGKLHLNAPVNLRPNEGWKTWRLETDIVLRNTTRS
jgi:prepilin-type N-terminal cleavage/methylation domain-containing protein